MTPIRLPDRRVLRLPELDEGEELFEISREHYARASKEAFLNKGRTCERPCVCERRTPAEACASGLEQYDKLSFCHRRVDRGEHGPAVVETLHVTGDHLDVRLAGEVLEEVRQSEVGLVAHGHNVAESDATLGGGAREGARERAAVGHECDVAETLLLDERAAVGSQPVRVVGEAQAVRADE